MSQPVQHKSIVKDATRRFVDLDDLRTFGVEGRDEGAGTLRDILIEDQEWTAQYLLVDAGSWLPGRLILIPITAMDHVDMDRRRVVLCYTRMELRRSIARISRLSGTSQKAAALRGASGSQPLWNAVVPAGASAQPVLRDRSIVIDDLPVVPEGRNPESRSAVIRSARDLLGNTVNRGDSNPIDRVQAVALSESDLGVAFVLVHANGRDTGNLVPIHPQAFTAIGWAEKTMIMGDTSSTTFSLLPSVTSANEITPNVEERIRELLISARPNNGESQRIH